MTCARATRGSWCSGDQPHQRWQHAQVPALRSAAPLVAFMWITSCRPPTRSPAEETPPAGVISSGDVVPRDVDVIPSSAGRGPLRRAERHLRCSAPPQRRTSRLAGHPRTRPSPRRLSTTCWRVGDDGFKLGVRTDGLGGCGACTLSYLVARCSGAEDRTHCCWAPCAQVLVRQDVVDDVLADGKALEVGLDCGFGAVLGFWSVRTLWMTCWRTGTIAFAVNTCAEAGSACSSRSLHAPSNSLRIRVSGFLGQTMLEPVERSNRCSSLTFTERVAVWPRSTPDSGDTRPTMV